MSCYLNMGFANVSFWRGSVVLLYKGCKDKNETVDTNGLMRISVGEPMPDFLGPLDSEGLEKTRVFLKKNSPVDLFGFFSGFSSFFSGFLFSYSITRAAPDIRLAG